MATPAFALQFSPLRKNFPTPKEDFDPSIIYDGKSSHTFFNHFLQNTLHEFSIFSMYNFKGIQTYKDFNLIPNNNTFFPDIIINSNSFFHHNLDYNQFKSILYLLREDIILIFRRCSDANFENISETDFTYPSFLKVIFQFGKLWSNQKLYFNISNFKFLPDILLKVISSFINKNISTIPFAQPQVQSNLQLTFLINNRKCSFTNNNLFYIKLIEVFLYMIQDLIINIHWPATIALTPIVANHMNSFQNPFHEDIKPIFRRQIEDIIFRNIETKLFEPFHTFYNFILTHQHVLFTISRQSIFEEKFDLLISLSIAFIRYAELTIRFLKITNNYVHTYNHLELKNHISLKNEIIFTFNCITFLFNNFRKSFAYNNTKIANSYFLMYQFNINKFIPSLGLQSEWGTFQNSFFLG
jgi:hypothetical protein